MSDYRISFVYQDSKDDWWFAIDERCGEESLAKPWFDGLTYVGPCATVEDAKNCEEFFQNTGYAAEELGPGGLLAPPPRKLRVSPRKAKEDFDEMCREIRRLIA
jgi:hypothetical protein